MQSASSSSSTRDSLLKTRNFFRNSESQSMMGGRHDPRPINPTFLEFRGCIVVLGPMVGSYDVKYSSLSTPGKADCRRDLWGGANVAPRAADKILPDTGAQLTSVVR